ncbi:helix-turn-helix domain-containing protein [Xylocopilactobacillus apis]|uniref:HTH cro/C1-type domain-containing protein n=1 Tax=Xylocopilactobacillus apis TaxID=2932183 RepID=A0AAU9CXH7_9LACO|nr:helix-turn-helix transcriptional regulator [Xylocopilactobacillus apis]BDR55978.1 hypothetical protein KIMC2_05400 [Xylocopilactobacillus apis]
MNYGNLLKSLRISRGLSQQQLAADISSQTALSRMEKSGNIPTDVLLNFLDKLDIHPIEFFTLAAEDHVTDSQKFLNQINKTRYDKKEMETFVKSEMELYQKNGILKHKINAMRSRAVYHKIHNLPLNDLKEIKETIQTYLMKFETWFINDVSLYTNLLFIFDNEFIKTHHQTILRSLNKFPLGQNQKHDYQINYANNAIILAFERNNLNSLDLYLETFNSFIKESPNSIYDRILYSIYTQLRDLMINFDQSRYNKLLAEIKIFELYELPNVTQDFTTFINDCLENKKTVSTRLQ